MNFQSKTMRLNNAEGVPYLTYNSLSEINFITHAFSTRLGGVSEGEFTSMNMAFNRGDDIDRVTENYRRFCKSAGFEFDSLVASAQDHHTFVRAVTSKDKGIGIYKPRDMQSVDALITNEPGVTLVTYYADCTPVPRSPSAATRWTTPAPRSFWRSATSTPLNSFSQRAAASTCSTCSKPTAKS